MDAISFITRVMCLCFKHYGSVSSWGRTVKHNKDVLGVPNSCHMLWIGCDVVLDEMERNDEFERDAAAFGLLPLLEGDHYHLQPMGLKK